jgi:hypothetical protein
MTKALVSYSAIAVGLVLMLAWVLTMAFDGPGDAAAIRLSAIVVLVVQLATFTGVKLVPQKHLIAGWGAGALLRFLTLVIYAVLVAKVLSVPITAALISMAVFFFLTTLIEPLLLKL